MTLIASEKPCSPPPWPTGMADKATVQQRHLAVAADAELSRRHPDEHYRRHDRPNPSPPPTIRARSSQ